MYNDERQRVGTSKKFDFRYAKEKNPFLSPILVVIAFKTV